MSLIYLNSTYREHMGGASGLISIKAQEERFKRQIEHCDNLYGKNCNTVINGNFNFDYLRWADEKYNFINLVEMKLPGSPRSPGTNHDATSDTNISPMKNL